MGDVEVVWGEVWRVVGDVQSSSCLNLSAQNRPSFDQQADAKFLPELFAQLSKRTPDDAEWRDLVAFLQVRRVWGDEGCS